MNPDTCIKYEDYKFGPAGLVAVKQAITIIDEYLAQGYTLTLRQIYYQFVARGWIANTQESYKRLGDIISRGRRSGLLDWMAIEDRTRHTRERPHWQDPAEIVLACAGQFHVDLWEGQPQRAEVWIEKDALAGVVEGACHDLDCPLLSCRGYLSDSEMWRASMRIVKRGGAGVETVIFHLGDHDPSGLDMTRDIERRLDLFGVGRWVMVSRIALTWQQIQEVNPPPNPAKVTDSRAAAYIERYGPDSWELDALDPAFLDKLVRMHVDTRITKPGLWNRRLRARKAGRAALKKVAASLNPQRAFEKEQNP